MGKKGYTALKIPALEHNQDKQIFFSTTSFSNCGYEISTTRKIRLALHDLPDILQRSASLYRYPLVIGWVNFQFFIGIIIRR